MERNTTSLSGFKKKKRLFETDVDRLSELPESILHHILSFLDMKEVVQTSLLSRNWRYTWCSVSNLSFSHNVWKNIVKYERKINGMGFIFHKKLGFMKFIDGVLLLRNNASLDKLSLSCNCYCAQDRIDMWINVAVKRQAKEFYLESRSGLNHVLPTSIFTSTITTFHLNANVQLPNSMCSATQLRTLELIYARLPYGDSNGEVVLSCPVLENLRLISCFYKYCEVFNISAPQLKNLVINNEDACYLGDCKIKICTPNLTTLELQGFIYKDYYVERLPSLVHAYIEVSVKKELTQHTSVQHLIEVLKSLDNVTNLELSNRWIQNIPTCQHMANQLPSQFCNLKHLNLLWGENSCIRVVTSLLKSSPYVETLIIQVPKVVFHPPIEENWEEYLLSECMLNHLKLIEVRKFHDQKNGLLLVKFLLKAAAVLEKIVIIPSTTLSTDEEQLHKISISVHSLPRSSSSAKIVFVNS
ncbi:hypothetical protein AQUCO_05100023v1 [Aquilegia coerulea]|uniref:F-box domain-containing protein n=1 Tax=Aquilegia coerulea TaxID=218851 RepID=A0A2G5CIW4_AQUCA|nr:hypothetical protein AQUCO_05100023v1 [Aquilegia coerulea]